MRIGVVCPYSLTVPGGVQGQVLGLARELRRQGYETRVLGPCDGPPPESFVTPLGNSLPTAANGSIAPLAPDPSAALRTIRALHDEEFDVVHLHEPLAPGPTVTTLLMRPAPLIGTFHAAGRSSSYQTLARPLKWFANRMDRKVVVSKDALALVQSHLGGDYEILFNGVEIDQIEATRPAATSHPTIFFCGRHEERKGLEVLLTAFGSLPESFRLWIASDGPDSPRLRAEHADDRRISWLGRISDAEKFARLRGASVLCAPSLRGESFGVVLIEAMAAGTAVVASGIDGYRNVATGGIDALLVEPGDAQALGAALTRVMTDQALADRLRANGHDRAQDFAMARLATEYLGIYRDVIDEHASTSRRRRRR